jgi:hypothetical protein
LAFAGGALVVMIAFVDSGQLPDLIEGLRRGSAAPRYRTQSQWLRRAHFLEVADTGRDVDLAIAKGDYRFKAILGGDLPFLETLV